MLVVICGPSGSGKTELQKALGKDYGFKEIVSCTTRSIRPGEADGVDYRFISCAEFKKLVDEDEFCEYEEYSQNRWYGTTKQSIAEALMSKDPYVAVLTPNGLRAVEKVASSLYKRAESPLLRVLVTANLGTRVKRYIDRTGEAAFDFDDMNEINARVNRDFGMFLKMENSVDVVLDNSVDCSSNRKPFSSLCEKVVESLQLRFKEASDDPAYCEKDEASMLL